MINLVSEFAGEGTDSLVFAYIAALLSERFHLPCQDEILFSRYWKVAHTWILSSVSSTNTEMLAFPKCLQKMNIDGAAVEN